MKIIKTLQETENPLFNRKELSLEVEADKTPSREEALKFLSEQYSVDENTIKIKNILGRFGARIFLINVNIYKTSDDKERFERKKKKEIEIEKRKAEKIAQAQQEEAEKDEPSEENLEKQKEETQENTEESNENSENENKSDKK